MPAGEGKGNHGGTKALWDDLADDTKGQASKMDEASKMDACPFTFDVLC